MSLAMRLAGLVLLVLAARDARFAFAGETGTSAGEAVSAANLARQIDLQFERVWDAAGLVPSRGCTDAEYLRRITLDLAGRIPTETEVRQFLADPSPHKRQDAVERLLASKDYARFAAVNWGNLLLGRGTGGKIFFQAPFRIWLEESFAKGMPFDEMTRRILTASGSSYDDPAIGWTLRHKADPDEMTGAVARIFLGTQIQCAQCHDHPFDKWKQADFYGLAAFFAQVRQERRLVISKVVRDLERGEIRLGGGGSGRVVKPAFLGERAPSHESGLPRRQQLAQWITAPGNSQFSKAICNRIWAQMFGRGLVDPVDDFGVHNPPAVAGLLDTLAAAWVSADYDLRFLFRALAQTRVYQLSSLPSPNNKQDEQLFSKADLRRQSPEQLLASVVVSTGITDNNSDIKESGLFKLLMAAVQEQFIFTFASMDESTEVSEFQGTIAQALMMMNSGPLERVTDLRLFDPLTAKLRACETAEEKIALLFRATLSRAPTARELQAQLPHFETARTSRQQFEVCEDLYWALLNTAEFAFNH